MAFWRGDPWVEKLSKIATTSLIADAIIDWICKNSSSGGAYWVGFLGQSGCTFDQITTESVSVLQNNLKKEKLKQCMFSLRKTALSIFPTKALC